MVKTLFKIKNPKGKIIKGFRASSRGILFKRVGTGARDLIKFEKKFGEKNVEAIQPRGKKHIQIFVKTRK